MATYTLQSRCRGFWFSTLYMGCLQYILQNKITVVCLCTRALADLGEHTFFFRAKILVLKSRIQGAYTSPAQLPYPATAKPWATSKTADGASNSESKHGGGGGRHVLLICKPSLRIERAAVVCVLCFRPSLYISS